MNRNELQRLAKKYLNGTATTEEKEMLNHWYDTIHSGEQVEYVSTDNFETEAGIKRQIFENIREKINSHESGREKTDRNGGIVKKIALRIASAAAVIFIAAGIVWHFYKPVVKTYAKGSEWINVTAKKIMKINLSDGSVVWLSANSVFKYPNIFVGKIRGVELVEGRAFFDVKHQNQHPFFVKTKNLDITVFGTSFDVRTNGKEGTTKVSVITGKVGISLRGHSNEPAIMLLPKQQVVLSKATSQLTKEVTKEAVRVRWYLSRKI